MDIAFGTHILDLEREEIENVHHRETLPQLRPELHFP
jgi:hypothetical protein